MNTEKDSENLEGLFDDVFLNDPPAAEAQEPPAGDDGQQASTDTPAEETPKKPEQDAETRSRQAEGRRRYEAEQRGYQQARADMSALIQELGIEDSDGAAVSTIEELEKLAQARRQQRWEAGRPTEADIHHAVREELQTQQAQAPAPMSAEDRAAVDRQLAEIRQMDPEMKDLNAILQSPAGPRFRELVGKGLDFKDAYKLAAEDRLAGIRANRQGAKTGGKDHLTSTSQRGSGDLDVPADELEIFRALNPDMSDADIRKFYNDYKKNG